ncbi:MAG: peptidylprolyl isomerase [Clostridia bacterium]
MHKIIITLADKREIKLALNAEIAPITVANFLSLVEKKYYDGLCFHRVIDSFMIQTGGYSFKDNRIIPAPNVPSIKGEFAQNGVRNSIKHTLGVISMARTNIKDSASSQFFICAADVAHLDGSYAAFGKTIDAASDAVVLDIAASPTDAVSGMFTDFPIPPIIIESIRIHND